VRGCVLKPHDVAPNHCTFLRLALCGIVGCCCTTFLVCGTSPLLSMVTHLFTTVVSESVFLACCALPLTRMGHVVQCGWPLACAVWPVHEASGQRRGVGGWCWCSWSHTTCASASCKRPPHLVPAMCQRSRPLTTGCLVRAFHGGCPVDGHSLTWLVTDVLRCVCVVLFCNDREKSKTV
jgi:hypothetical protein